MFEVLLPWHYLKYFSSALLACRGLSIYLCMLLIFNLKVERKNHNAFFQVSSSLLPYLCTRNQTPCDWFKVQNSKFKVASTRAMDENQS